MSTAPEGGVPQILEAVRRHLVRRTLQVAFLWGGVAVGVALGFAWLLAGPGGWERGTPGPLVLDLALLLALAGIAGAAGAVRRGELEEGKVAAAMDRARKLPRGTVIGAAELAREVPPGVSTGLAARAQEGVVGRLDDAPDVLAGSLEARAATWVRRGAAALSLTAVILTFLALGWPERSGRAWSGLVSPVSLLERPEPGPLEVRPGDARVLRGEPLEIRVRAPGRAGVSLTWTSAGEVPGGVELPVDDGRASHRFPRIEGDLEYRVTAPDGAASPTFRVEAMDPLFFAGLSLALEFPPHTRRPPEEHRGEVPPLTVPAGTRFRLRGRASRPLERAALEREDGQERIELGVDGPRFSGSWVPARSGIFRWSVAGSGAGVPSELPDPLEVTLVADSVPEVEVVFPGRDTTLPLNLRQPLAVEARDDYGLARVELEAARMGAAGEEEEATVRRLDPAGSRSVTARPVLDLSTWDLLPGDTVRYRVRAVDNAPASQTAVTPWYHLRTPEASELERGAVERLDEMTDAVEELARETEEAQEATRDLQRRSGAGRDRAGEETRRRRLRAAESDDEAAFQDREDVRQAVERQEELLAGADSIRESLAELSRSMRDAGAPDPELRRDLAELQELMQDVAPEELREQLREMSRSLDRGDLRSAMESLTRLSRDQEEMRRRLKESLERFRRAAVEQEFRVTSSRARELAEQEEALSRALEEGEDLGLRAQQQEALRSSAGELEEQLRELEERLEAMEEADARDGARRAGDRSREAREAMARAARQARTSSPQEASEEAARATEALSEAARELEESGRAMSERWNEEVRQALRRTADDALTLARRQEELNRDPRAQGPPEARADLRGDQAALRQGVERMAENLRELSQLSPETGRELSSLMGAAMGEMSELLEQMAGERPGSRPGSRPARGGASAGAVDALNRVAMSAMAGSGGMGQEGQGGSARSLQEELEGLAQEQGRLARRTGSLVPMRLGQEALEEQLRRMSRGQQAVAGDLDELSRREKEGEDEALGDLGALAREAEEVARELEGGRLEPEVLQRQQRLFHRLLDAGRSLEKDEFSQRRESTAAGDSPSRDVPALTAEALGALPYALPGTLELQALPPAQQELVLEYFRRLNRRGDGGGPGR